MAVDDRLVAFALDFAAGNGFDPRPPSGKLGRHIAFFAARRAARLLREARDGSNRDRSPLSALKLLTSTHK